MPDNPPETPPIVYTVRQFCQAAQISKATLYELWARGEGPPRCQFGRRVMIPKTKALRWIERKSKTTA